VSNKYKFGLLGEKFQEVIKQHRQFERRMYTLIYAHIFTKMTKPRM